MKVTQAHPLSFSLLSATTTVTSGRGREVISRTGTGQYVPADLRPSPSGTPPRDEPTNWFRSRAKRRRFPTPSLRNNAVMCPLTVFSERLRSIAISLFVAPLTRRCAISRSRKVRPDWLGLKSPRTTADWLALCDTTSSRIVAISFRLTHTSPLQTFSMILRIRGVGKIHGQ